MKIGQDTKEKKDSFQLNKMTTKDMLHFEDWEKIDLRVGKITNVEEHPNADKLYVLKVEFGGKVGTLTIVAGLREHCTPESLKGKSAIFIINLEPRELRGIKSEGMILAAINHNKTKVCFLEPSEDIEPGSEVS